MFALFKYSSLAIQYGFYVRKKVFDIYFFSIDSNRINVNLFFKPFMYVTLKSNADFKNETTVRSIH